MNTKIITLAVAASLTAGCGSVPQPAIPDGRHRIAVNTQAEIDEYKTRVAEERAATHRQAAIRQEIDSLNRQIADLKMYMMAMAVNAENTLPKQRPAPLQGRAPAAKVGERESIEVRDTSIVFRVTHPVAKVTFAPSTELRASLIKAAREGQYIEIRGRTDSNIDDAANLRIAMARAQTARHFLVKHGVRADKIRMSYMASGGFVADNSTETGKATNRRVEIEAIDLNTSAFEPTKPMMIGSAQ